MLRHIQGLYAGVPGARSWRRYLSEQGVRPGAGADVLRSSLRVFACAA
jgi:tRNA-dihydrouridine synthase A